MRQLKFRGKRVDNGEWVYGDLVHNAFNGHRIFPAGIQIPGCYPDEVISETVGQFTGLHDKNGKEIYEGDIPDGYGAVFFSNEYLGYFAESTEFECGYKPICDIPIIEIIGNIHENPELLEGRE